MPQAADYFIFVALGGVVGKIVVTFLAPLIGRRPLGVLWGIGAVAALAAAGYYHDVVVDGLPMMVILLCASTFFIEGGFSNLAPYTVESYGVNLGARASGLGQAANGVGKILGPLSLALIAGTSNIGVAARRRPTRYCRPICSSPSAWCWWRCLFRSSAGRRMAAPWRSAPKKRRRSGGPRWRRPGRAEADRLGRAPAASRQMPMRRAFLPQ